MSILHSKARTFCTFTPAIWKPGLNPQSRLHHFCCMYNTDGESELIPSNYEKKLFRTKPWKSYNHSARVEVALNRLQVDVHSWRIEVLNLNIMQNHNCILELVCFHGEKLPCLLKEVESHVGVSMPDYQSEYLNLIPSLASTTFPADITLLFIKGSLWIPAASGYLWIPPDS